AFEVGQLPPYLERRWINFQAPTLFCLLNHPPQAGCVPSTSTVASASRSRPGSSPWSVVSSLREHSLTSSICLSSTCRSTGASPHVPSTVTFEVEIKQALRSHAERLVWEVAGLRLQAIESIHRPLGIIRHRRPARRHRGRLRA